MKKILFNLALTILSLLVLLTLASCGGNDNADGKENGGSSADTAEQPVQTGDVADRGETGDGGDAGDETEPVETEPSGYDENGVLLPREEYMNQQRLVIYPDFHEDINRNYDYRVSVTMNGRTHPLTVYNHTMEYSIFNRSIGSDIYRRFTRFAFSGGSVRVDIKVSKDFEAYSVIPSAKNFKSEFKDGVISVYLDEPDYFLIRLDNDDNSLISVCADYPEYPGDIPSKDDPNVIYIDDWYESEDGLLFIDQPDTVIYVEPQAVLNCRVYVQKEATNTKMFGRGAVVDPFSDIYNYKIRDGGGGIEGYSYKLTTLNGENSILDGLFYLDTRTYNIAVNGSGVKITNVKCFSTLMTTDGISVYGGTGMTADHCLLYVGDNAIVYSAKESVFTDITIGTTCAALFPQETTIDTTFDGIYIFRTNDGVINNQYNGDQSMEREHSNLIKNLDCMDCINIPHFFRGRKMGVLEKTFIFENISIPSPTGITDPHKGLITGGVGKLYVLDNGSDYIYTDNYTLKFINFYMDGELLENLDKVTGTNMGENNVFIFETGDEDYKQVYRQWNVVNYTAKGVTYIGSYKFSPEHEPIERDGKVYFPTESILKGLRRTSATPETIDINGVNYSSGEDLVAAGAAENFVIKSGNYIFTPCYDGEELFLDDEGEISRFSESESYKVDMEVEKWNGETVYVMYDHGNYYTGGVSRMITEELKMYGEGTYVLSFDICGYGSGNANVTVKYDDYIATYTAFSKSVAYSRDWSTKTFEIEVSGEMIECEGCILSVIGDSSSKIPYYALKNISLKKVG